MTYIFGNKITSQWMACPISLVPKCRGEGKKRLVHAVSACT